MVVSIIKQTKKRETFYWISVKNLSGLAELFRGVQPIKSCLELATLHPTRLQFTNVTLQTNQCLGIREYIWFLCSRHFCINYCVMYLLSPVPRASKVSGYFVRLNHGTLSQSYMSHVISMP